MTLDDTSALVVIDLLKGIAGMPTVHPMSEIVERSAQLARAFRKQDLPVVLVTVSAPPPGRTDTPRPAYSLPPGWNEFVPELDLQPTDHTVTKKSWGAFLGTDLDAYLRGRGVTQIVLTGVATSMGVESTARSAHDLGYNVALISDAMTDRDPDNHSHAIGKIFPRLGEVTTTEEVLAMLKGA
jgi:nicotinamidase-related amidase